MHLKIVNNLVKGWQERKEFVMTKVERDLSFPQLLV